MTLDFHNKLPENNNINPSTVAPVSPPAPTTGSTPATPVKIVEGGNTDTVKEGFVKQDDNTSIPQEETLEKRKKELEEKVRLKTATPEEIEELQGYIEGQQSAEEKSKQNALNLSPEAEKKFSEYMNIRAKHGSIGVIKKYLSDTDSSYNNASAAEKRKIEKDFIDNLKDIVYTDKSGNKKLSAMQRQTQLSRIADLCSMSAVSKKPMEELVAIDSGILQERLAEHEHKRALKIFKEIDLNNDKIDANTKIDNLAKALLKYDETYTSMKEGSEKEKYRQDYIAQLASKLFKREITADDLNSKTANFYKNAIIEFMKIASKDEQFNIDQLDNKTFSKLIDKITPENLEKLPEDVKKDFKLLKTINDVKSNIDKDYNDITEGDIFKYLLNKKDLKPEEKDLLEFYKGLDENKIINLDKTRSSQNSIVVKSLLFHTDIRVETDKTIKEAFKNSKEDILSDKPNRQIQKLIETLGFDSKKLDQLDKFLEKNNYTKEEIKKFHKIYNLDEKSAIATVAAHTVYKDADTIIAAEISMKNASNPEAKEKLKSINGIYVAKMDKNEFAKLRAHKRAEEVDNDVADSSWHAFSHAAGRNASDLTYVQNQIQNSGLSDKFKEYSVKSMTANATADQQRYIINYYENTTNKNIIKGLAAAEPEVHESVKQEYSQKLDKIIQHNGLQNDKEIQTARQTGQTSSERAQASENSTSASSSERANQTSAQAQTSSASSIQGAKVRTETIYISSETKSYANTIKATLAQLDSENKKAEAMKTIAESIAKIQANEIKYEAKVAQQKIQQQKQAVEAAKQENAKKSEEQLKTEQKAATESCVKEIQEELSQSAEAKEIQKYFSDPSWFEKLKSYAKDGQIDQVYQMLAKIPKAQDLFIEKLATKHISTITHFIKTADKSVIKHLVELNPSLVAVLDRNLLLEINIPKATIIKYGDKDQIAGLLSDLQLASTKETLKEFYEVLGVKDNASEEADASEVVKKNASVKGDDNFINQLQRNMKIASRDYASSGMQGTVVPNWKEPDKKVPREMWG